MGVRNGCNCICSIKKEIISNNDKSNHILYRSYTFPVTIDGIYYQGNLEVDVDSGYRILCTIDFYANYFEFEGAATLYSDTRVFVTCYKYNREAVSNYNISYTVHYLIIKN